MNRLHQVALIFSTVIACWLGMQDIHESGHVLGAWLTGGRVTRVVLNPLTFSRTDLAENPHPLIVVWTGPLVGVIAPTIIWLIAGLTKLPGAFVLRFFAGFCLLANGTYIGVGSFSHAGDSGEMLRHGSAPWQLWLFGIVASIAGLWLWHGQGTHFGLGKTPTPQIGRGVCYSVLVMCAALLILGFSVGGQ